MPSLYKFQEQSIDALLSGKHLCLLGTGCGKSAVSVKWAETTCKNTGKTKVLITTTPSKRDSGDYLNEADVWADNSWRESLSEFEVISWHALKKWVNAHWNNLDDYVYIFDEVAKAKSGVSSGMGKAFLRIAHQTEDWVGLTATPGDKWIDFYAYFTACRLVRNKTAFKARYVTETFYKGYPDIIGYRHEDELLHMWKKISTSPDTSQMTKELPPETHHIVKFKKPAGYDKAIKTRMSASGEWLDSTMKLAHHIRELCFTKAKQQWVTDFLEGLGEGAVIFYTYREEGNKLEEIAKKALPKEAKVWRIDGDHHEIPTVETTGKYDVVLCQWQSGSEGLNLQHFSYMVAVSSQYSYSTLTQAEGRIRRIGQTRPQFFYQLLCEKTIEEDIAKTLLEKKDFSELTWSHEKGIDINDSL